LVIPHNAIIFYYSTRAFGSKNQQVKLGIWPRESDQKIRSPGGSSLLPAALPFNCGFEHIYLSVGMVYGLFSLGKTGKM